VPTFLIYGTPFTEMDALMMTVVTRHPEIRLARAESSASRAGRFCDADL
jgi:hypothetical protein